MGKNFFKPKFKIEKLYHEDMGPAGFIVFIKLWWLPGWISVTKDSTVLIGVLAEYAPDKAVILSASNDKTLAYYTFDPLEVEISKLNVSNRKKAYKEFERAGYVWNSNEMSVSPIIQRGRQGKMYWSITDKFTIRCEADNKTGKHNQRFNVGNYFNSPEEAAEALKVLVSFIQEHRTPQTSVSSIENRAL